MFQLNIVTQEAIRYVCPTSSSPSKENMWRFLFSLRLKVEKQKQNWKKNYTLIEEWMLSILLYVRNERIMIGMCLGLLLCRYHR